MDRQIGFVNVNGTAAGYTARLTNPQDFGREEMISKVPHPTMTQAWFDLQDQYPEAYLIRVL